MNQIGTLWGDHKLEPNFGLLSIASVLKKEGYKIDLMDLNIYDHYCRDKYKSYLTTDKIKSIIEKKKAKIFAISSMTVNFKFTEEIIQIIKEVHSESLIIIGGIHASFNVGNILKNNKNIDFIIAGEGEETILDFLKSIEKGKNLSSIKGLSGRYHGGLFHNPNRRLIKDLDVLPPPAFELLPKELFPFLTRIYTSRGCSGSCRFCVVNCFFNNRFRFRDPDKVFEEIQYIKDNFNPTMLLIGDLTFLDNKRLSHELCDIMKRERFDQKWWCQSRADRINKKTSGLLNKSGCYQIALGIESPSEIKNKNITLNKSIKACENLKNNNLIVQTYWMFGLPYETKESSKNTTHTIKQLIRNRLTDLTHIGITVPYPGSELCEKASENGLEAELSTSL